MLPTNLDLDRDFIPSSAQAQIPAHCEPFNISLRSSRPPSPFSNPFLGNQGELSPTILVAAERPHRHTHFQPAIGSACPRDNDLTTVPRAISGAIVQPLQPHYNNNGSYGNGSSQSSAFSHGTSDPFTPPLRRSARLRRASHTNTCLCDSYPSTVLRRANTDPTHATSSSSSTYSCHSQPNSRSTAILLKPTSLICPDHNTRTQSSPASNQQPASYLNSDLTISNLPVPNSASSHPSISSSIQPVSSVRQHRQRATSSSSSSQTLPRTFEMI